LLDEVSNLAITRPLLVQKDSPCRTWFWLYEKGVHFSVHESGGNWEAEEVMHSLSEKEKKTRKVIKREQKENQQGHAQVAFNRAVE